MNIGFIGLGIMGKPMAKNLLKFADLLRKRRLRCLYRAKRLI